MLQNVTRHDAASRAASLFTITPLDLSGHHPRSHHPMTAMTREFGHRVTLRVTWLLHTNTSPQSWFLGLEQTHPE